MKLPSSRAKPWRRLLGAISVLLVLLGVGAVITGRLGYVVTDGISMEPLYHTGDLVVIALPAPTTSGRSLLITVTWTAIW